jgi:hypothetical protein
MCRPDSGATSLDGKDASKRESKRYTSNEGISSKRSTPPTHDGPKSTNDFMQRKQHRESLHDSLLVRRAQVWPSPTRHDRTISPPKRKNEKGPPATGADHPACCTDTRVETAASPTNDAIGINQVAAPSPNTMEDITPTSTTRKHVPITGIMRASSSWASMPRRNRPNTNGNGPDDFGRDSPVWGWGAGQTKLVVAGSATEAETGRRVGCGALPEDSRLDLSSRTGSRPWTGGDDTILTPFSLSPMTDAAVDSLPELFLAYCTLADSDDIMSDDDRAVPRGSDSDPVPLLTSCALGLSSTFLSRSRR